MPSLRVLLRAVADAGVDWIQVREKEMPARDLLDLVKEAVQVAGAERVIVNDRLDGAVAGGAGGIHLGRESVSAAAVDQWRRSRAGARTFQIGVSCHSVDEIRQAEQDGADYAFFGPVFATPSKERFGAPRGLSRLAEACEEARVPVLAIGGITAANFCECLRAGAAGVAAIRLFQESDDLPRLIRFLCK